MKVVVIVWHDSASIPGWEPHDTVKRTMADGPLVCTSVGLLLEDRSDAVVIIQSHNEDQYGNATLIPKVAIQSVDVIGDRDLLE